MKIFVDLAYRLGILPSELVFALEALIGVKVRKELDLSKIAISALYMMQDIEDDCQANCAFCVQSRDSRNALKSSMLVEKKLLRFPLTAMARKIDCRDLARKGIESICIQTIYNKSTAANLIGLVRDLNSFCSIPLTACCIPVSRSSLMDLKEVGLDMIFINYETATPDLFSKILGEGVNGPYRWDKVTRSIDDALEIFGKGKVGSHLQIGFGESQKDALRLIQMMTDKHALVSLIAFRPLAGTSLEANSRSSHENFHKIQLGAYLIQKHRCRIEDMTFDSEGNTIDFGLEKDELEKIINTGRPFRNRGGCPGCNRIYYETIPGEHFYTYPRELDDGEIKIIQDKLLADHLFCATSD